MDDRNRMSITTPRAFVGQSSTYSNILIPFLGFVFHHVVADVEYIQDLVEVYSGGIVAGRIIDNTGSESIAPMVETSENRSSPGIMNQGKVPKRIHKAEREKLKREHLNELFLDLANALDLDEQNSGKASILSEASKLLKDLLCQIQSLKKENVSLLSESHYVTMEKNELKDENSSLETQIEKLQGEIQERMAQSKPDLNLPPQLDLDPQEQTNFPGQSLQMPTIESTLQQGPAILVVPFRPDLQAVFPAPTVTELTPKPTPVISKPHARYPTPADSWPSQLLGEQPTSR